MPAYSSYIIHRIVSMLNAQVFHLTLSFSAFETIVLPFLGYSTRCGRLYCFVAFLNRSWIIMQMGLNKFQLENVVDFYHFIVYGSVETGMLSLIFYEQLIDPITTLSFLHCSFLDNLFTLFDNWHYLLANSWNRTIIWRKENHRIGSIRISIHHFW